MVKSSIRTLQYAIRGFQFACTAIILAIYSYILAALANRSLPTPTDSRAVEGIAGVATLYIVVICILLRWVVGVLATSFLTVVFDFAFMCCFVYVAVANRGGASSCVAGTVNTPFGSGDANDYPKDAASGFVSLPKLSQACQLESACLAVSIFLIFFFIASILVEIRLGRMRHREKRFGPDGLPPSKTEGGLSIFSRMRWFQMYTDSAQDSLPTHSETGDENRDENRNGAAPPQMTMSGAIVADSNPRPSPPPGETYPPRQDPSPPPLRDPTPVLTLPSPPHMYNHPSQQSVAYFPQEPQRPDSWRGGAPAATSMMMATTRPPQRMESMPLSIVRTDPDSFPQAVQASTDLSAHHQPSHPWLQWTESFPRQNQPPANTGRGTYEPVRQSSPPAPQRPPPPHAVLRMAPQVPPQVPPQAPPQVPPHGTLPPYPDSDGPGRIESRPDVPYPDDQSERVPFPGDHRARGDRNSRYPNYEYENSLFGR